jgi:hypothetical protein
VQTFVALGLAAVVTYGSWVLVERPFLRWKDRLEVERRDHDRPPPAKTKSTRNSSFRHVAIPMPD